MREKLRHGWFWILFYNVGVESSSHPHRCGPSSVFAVFGKIHLDPKKNERFTFSYCEMSGLCADNQQFEKYANDTKKLPVCKGCF